MLAVSSYAIRTERLEPGYKNRPPGSKNEPLGVEKCTQAAVSAPYRELNTMLLVSGDLSGKVT